MSSNDMVFQTVLYWIYYKDEQSRCLAFGTLEFNMKLNLIGLNMITGMTLIPRNAWISL